MKFTKLLLYVGLTILAFFLLSLVLKLAAWLIHIALTIGLVVIVIALIYQYVANKHSHKHTK